MLDRFRWNALPALLGFVLASGLPAFAQSGAMPLSSPGRLSRDVNSDIVAYILNVNQFPTGKVALPADVQALKLIRLDAVKPD